MLQYHAARMEKTMQDCLGTRMKYRLEELLAPPPGNHPLQKCRILYGKDFFQAEWLPYQRKMHAGHKVVHDDTLDYSYKYADRQAIDRHVRQAPENHDVIFVRKGLVTDASYSNLVFFDGENWVTPQVPLLPGVMRAFLLDAGTILEGEIHPDDLGKSTVFKKINALNPFESAPVYFIGK